MDTELALMQAIEKDPGDGMAWQVLADWLEEEGQPERAEVTRLHTQLRTRAPRRGKEPEARLQALLAGGARPAVPTRVLDVGNGVGMTFALVPPGGFWMGSVQRETGRDTDEEPRRRVEINKGFYLGVFPVTQRQWAAVMDDNPSTHRGEDRPVHAVGWRIFQEFLTRLGERLGRECRPPSEAEWEYACRAGTTSPFHTGTGVEALRRAAWSNVSSPSAFEPHPVGQLLPNAFGLHDMHGNVWEWCSDWYSARYDVADSANTYRNVSHAMRGGAWNSDARWCRSAARNRCGEDYQFSYLGCRVCLSLD